MRLGDIHEKPDLAAGFGFEARVQAGGQGVRNRW